MNQSSDIYGYHGVVLVVDLTTRVVHREPLPETVLRNFIGGTGLAAYLLYQHCPPGTGPARTRKPAHIRVQPPRRQ